MNTPFGYLLIASNMQDEVTRSEMAEVWRPLLAAAGGTLASEADLDGSAPLVYFVLTGGTEQEILQLRAQRAQSHPEEPVLLLAHTSHNSLPAALETLARVQQDHHPGRIIFLDPEATESCLEAVQDSVRCVAAVSFLRGARIGVIGQPSDWLVASAPDSAIVRERWGPTLVNIPLERVREGMATERAAQGHSFLERSPRAVTGPSSADLDSSAAIYRALRGLVQEFSLDALTIRCFDLVLKDRATGCLALARLNDEGLPAGCEGDIPSVLGLLWTRFLTGQPGWMANPASVDHAKGELLLAHCTVPVTMVTQFDLQTHFESGLGAAIQGEFAQGPVTLLRIGGKELDQVRMAEGTLIASSSRQGFCRTQVTVSTDPAWLTDLMDRPLGNHVLLLRGSHTRQLHASWSMIAPP